MSAEDYVVRILLEAQSKIGPTFAAAAAEAKKLEDSFKGTNKTAGDLDKRLSDLDGRAKKATGSLRDYNGILERVVAKTNSFSENLNKANTNLRGLNRNAELAANSFGKFFDVVESIEKRLVAVDKKLEEFGARKATAQIKVEGTEKAVAEIKAVKTELDKLDGDSNDGIASSRALNRKLTALRREYDNFYKARDKSASDSSIIEIDNLEKEIDAFKGGLERRTQLQKDFDTHRLANAQDQARRLTSIEEAAERVKAASQKKSVDDAIREVERQSAAEIKINSQKTSILKRTTAATKRLNATNSENEKNVIRRELADIQKEAGGIKFGRETQTQRVRVQVEIDRNRLEAESLKIKNSIERNAERGLRDGIGAAVGGGGDGGKLAAFGERFGREFSGGFSISFGQILTVVVTTAIAAIQPLLTAVTALAGALVAVGAAAGIAAAGIGGVLVAGISQALPLVGLLAFAFSRVAAVLNVAKLATTAHDKANTQGAGVDKTRENSLRALAKAHEGVADAQRNLTKAQDALNDANRQGVRTLTDLARAQQNSVLTADQANIKLAQNLASGNVGSIQQDILDASGANIDANRATVDNGRAQAGGVSGLPAVASAREGVESSKRALKDANDALKDASDNLKDSSAKVGSAANNYANALGKLSGAEQKLLKSVQAFQKIFTDKNSPFRKISDIIVSSFADALNQVAKLLKDPAILGALKELAEKTADAVREIARFLTSGPIKAALEFFTRQSASNLGTVTKIIENLVTLFLAISQAASPALSALLKSISGFLADISTRASSKGGPSSLAKFFIDALVPIKSFGGLIRSILNLFLALAGPGGAADAGTSLVDRLSKTIDRATNYIKDNSEKVRDFFKKSVDGASSVGNILIGLGKLFLDTFNPENLKNFADFLDNIVFPALVKAVNTIGKLVGSIVKFGNSDSGKFVLELGVAFVGLNFILGRTLGFVGNLAESFIRATKFAKEAIAATKDLKAAQELGIVGQGALGATAGAGAVEGAVAAAPAVAVVAAVAGIALLLQKFHLLDDVVKAFKQGISDIGDQIRGPIDDLNKSFDGLADSVGLKGTGGALKLLAQIIAGTLILSIKTLAGLIGGALAAAIKNLQNVVNTFAQFIRDIKKFFTDLGTLIGDLVHLRFGKLAGDFYDLGKDIVRSLIHGVGNFAKTLADAFIGPFKAAYDAFKGFVQGLPVVGRLFGHQTNKTASGGSTIFGDLRNNLGNEAGGFGPATGVLGVVQGATKNANKKSSVKLPTTFTPEEAELTPVEAKAISKLWQDIDNSARSSANDIAKQVRDMRVGIQATLDKLTKDGSASFDKFKDAGRDSMHLLAQSLKTTFGGIADSITNAMSDAMQAVHDGFKYITDTTNDVLTALGAKPSKITIKNPPKDGLFGGEHKAVGGYIGMAGERGKDNVHAVLGRGEAVLNYAQQPFVNAALQEKYGFGLGGLFKKVRGQHAGPAAFAGGGIPFASGGFFPAAGTNYSEGDEPAIAKRLNQLAKALGLHLIGISGYRTPQHSVEVGGFANDPHTRGAASDTPGVEGVAESVLEKYGLTRPFAGAKEADHIQLLGKSIGAVIANTAANSDAVIKSVVSPHVAGGGVLGTVANAVLKLAISAANSKTGDSSSAGSLAGFTSGGGNTSANSKLAHKMMLAFGYPESQWPSLQQLWQHESGFSTTAGHLPYAYGIPQADPGAKMASVGKDWLTNPITQIKWGLQYIKSVYKNPSVAWGGWHNRYGGGNSGYAGGGFAGIPSWGGWHGNGLDQTFSSPTIIGVGERGREHVKVTPYAGGGGNGLDSTVQTVTTSRLITGLIGDIGTTDSGLGFNTVLKAFNRLVKTLNNFKKKSTHDLDHFSNIISLVLQKDGPLDALLAAVTTRFNQASAAIKAATFQITGSGPVRAIDQIGSDRLNLGALQQQRSGLNSIGDSIGDTIKGVQNRIDVIVNRAGTKKAKKGDPAALARLEVDLKALTKRQNDLATLLADNAEAIVEAAEAVQNDLFTQITSTFSRIQTKLDQIKRIRTAQGDKGNNADIFDQEITNAHNQITDLVGVFNQAQASGNTQLAAQIADQIDELNTSIVELAAQKIQAAIDAVTQAGQDANSRIDLASHIAVALGAPGANQTRIGQLQKNDSDTITSLTDILNNTPGLTDDQKQQLRDKIQALSNDITDLAIEGLQSAIDDVNNAAQHGLNHASVLQRLGQLGVTQAQAASSNYNVTALGRPNFAAIGSALQSRAPVIQQQIAGLQGQIIAAQNLPGGADLKAISDLTDQIESLQADLVDNAQAIRDNTDAAVNYAIAQDQNNNNFFLSLSQAGLSINEALNTLHGNPQGTGSSGFLAQQGTIIKQGQTQNEQALASILGVSSSRLTGASGTGLVSIIQSLTQNAIGSGKFDDTQIATIEQLAQAILGQEQATIENTTALQNLNSSFTQTFTSTAFQRFRQSIFDGSGGLLPQYDIPGLATGTPLVTRGGLFNLHPGEAVVPANQNNTNSSRGDQIIQITTPTEVADPDYLSRKIAWNIAQSGRQ